MIVLYAEDKVRSVIVLKCFILLDERALAHLLSEKLHKRIAHAQNSPCIACKRTENG